MKVQVISSGPVGSAAGSVFVYDTVSAFMLSSAVMLDGLNRWGGSMAGLRLTAALQL